METNQEKVGKEVPYMIPEPPDFKKNQFEDAPFPFQIKLLNERIRAVKDADWNEHGLTYSQFSILLFLMKNQDHKVTQKDIAEATHVTHPTVIGLLDRLEEKGLVIRKVDEENHRYKNILLTERAKALLDEHYHVTRQSDAEMVEGLTEEERHELTRLLATVYRNLLQMEKDRQAGNFNGNH